MPIPPLGDLTPKSNPMGGSPKSPSGGIPVAEYQQYSGSENGAMFWRSIAASLGGLIAGLVLAWFTAFSGHGVTQTQMEEYVDKHSPYLADKPALSEHQRVQDEELGKLAGRQDRVFETLSTHTNDITDCKREVTRLEADLKTKMDLVASFLEQQKAKK
jgi:hypothetical protein